MTAFVLAWAVLVIGAIGQARRSESKPPLLQPNEKDVGDKVTDVTPSLTPSALHQLPPPPADFTGRTAELGELLPKLASGGVAISGLQGLGGVGKTALALMLAHQLVDVYPDAQIFLDLKGASPQPLTAAEAMLHVVRAYRPDQRPPESEAELAGLYRSVLHGRRALLLMDNAAGPQQVAPLIPPEGCALLVTSRHKFTLPGLFAVDLDVLPPEDACALLLAIAPRIGDRAGALALRATASAITTHPDLAVEDYLRRLAETHQRLGVVDPTTGQSVEASLSLSYDLLTLERQGLFAALAVFPDSFDLPAAAAVWDIEQDPAGDALSGLAAASLAEWDATTERYRLHDLVRDFADARLPAEARAAAARRHAGHYFTVAAACDERYLQGHQVPALARFDLEWGNIGAGQALAMASAGEDDGAAELCMNYPDAGRYCLDLRLHPRERVRWLEAALAAARRLGRRDAEGAHLGNLGSAYADLGEPRRAIEHYEQALAIAREMGDRAGEARASWNLGLALEGEGDPAGAAAAMQALVDYEQELGHPDAEKDAARLAELRARLPS